ncbi:MAG: membrane protein insertase YidC [Chloroflexi bacterium]|nr:membrane protein insertase YidC [Chloroflexota bacterium]
MEFLGLLWSEIILRPMTNSLVLLYTFLFHNFGLSIIIFTIFVRLVTIPLMVRQLRQTKAMSDLQPKLKEVQQKYAKDRQRLSQETMRLYREHGVNPVGCLGPLLIQFPIWIGLYQALVNTLPSTPESLMALSQRLYSWLGVVHGAVPVSSHFLWLDLAVPDRTPVLPLLTGISMWVMQKMTTFPSSDPRQQQTNQMMLWMMPLMFTFFTFQFPSGLALYWVVSNIVGIVIQYFVTGWGTLLPQRKSQAPATEPQPAEESGQDGRRRNSGKDGGRGRRTGSQRAGH